MERRGDVFNGVDDQEMKKVNAIAHSPNISYDSITEHDRAYSSTEGRQEKHHNNDMEGERVLYSAPNTIPAASYKARAHPKDAIASIPGA